MTIAMNIVLAVIVVTGVVGLLALNIFAARTPAQPRASAAPVKGRSPARQRAFGTLGRAGA
jgi:hypothetical protein